MVRQAIDIDLVSPTNPIKLQLKLFQLNLDRSQSIMLSAEVNQTPLWPHWSRSTSFRNTDPGGLGRKSHPHQTELAV